MNLKESLGELRSGILSKIEEAAQKGETLKVTTSSKMLEELEAIRTAFDSLEHRFEDLRGRFEFQPIAPSLEPTTMKMNRREHLSAKAQGELKRQDFIDTARRNGVGLTYIKGVKYRSPRNNLIGIASANENRQGRWFLGLKRDAYDAIVLLCEDNNKHQLTFILPSSFVRDLLPKLSSDQSGDQLKFNVVRSHNRFHLKVPNIEDQPLDNMVDRFDYL